MSPSNHRLQALDKGLVAVLFSAAMIGVMYFLAQANDTLLYVLSNGLPPILALAALVFAAVALRTNGVSFKDRVSMVWLGYSLGVLFWFLGESTWAVYTLLYSIPIPFPSPADVFWLAGYAPLMCAILLIAWPFREFFLSRKMLAVILGLFVLAGLLLLELVPATYASEIGEGFVTVAISLAYPLLDVALLVVALPILFLFGKGTYWRPFMAITLGLLLTFAADVLFTWTTLNGTYYDGSYLELFFHWSYLALAYGFYLRSRRGLRLKTLE